MGIVIDKLRRIDSKPFGHYNWCHCMSDAEDGETAERELRVLCWRLGLKWSWLHNGTHFDLTESKRLLAIKYGAKEVSVQYIARISMAKKRAKNLGITYKEVKEYIDSRYGEI